MFTTRVLRLGAQKGARSRIGGHPAPCYGFTGSVTIPSPSVFTAINDSWIDSWLWEDYPQVRYVTSPSPVELLHRTQIRQAP